MDLKEMEKFDSNGFRHGLWEFYNHLNSTIYKANYKHGVLHGRSELFLDGSSITGQPGTIVFLHNGVQEGLEITLKY